MNSWLWSPGFKSWLYSFLGGWKEPGGGSYLGHLGTGRSQLCRRLAASSGACHMFVFMLVFMFVCMLFVFKACYGQGSFCHRECSGFQGASTPVGIDRQTDEQINNVSY